MHSHGRREWQTGRLNLGDLCDDYPESLSKSRRSADAHRGNSNSSAPTARNESQRQCHLSLALPSVSEEQDQSFQTLTHLKKSSAKGAPATNGGRNGCRRQSHAEVEQRRRVRVAQHTEDLGRALPTVGEKQDKLTILKQTCVTLRRLRTSRRRRCKAQGRKPARQRIGMEHRDLAPTLQMATDGFTVTIDCASLQMTDVSEQVQAAGYTKMEVENKKLLQFIHPDDVERVETQLTPPSPAQLIQAVHQEFSDFLEFGDDFANCCDGGRFEKSFYMRMIKPTLLTSPSDTEFNAWMNEFLRASPDSYMLCKVDGYFKARFNVSEDESIKEESYAEKTYSGCDFIGLVSVVDLDEGALEAKKKKLDGYDLLSLARINKQAEFTFLDSSWEAFYELRHKDLIGSTLWDLVHVSDLSKVQRVLEHVVAKKEEADVSFRLRKGSGEFCWVSSCWTPILNPWTNHFETIVLHCAQNNSYGLITTGDFALGIEDFPPMPKLASAAVNVSQSQAGLVGDEDPMYITLMNNQQDLAMALDFSAHSTAASTSTVSLMDPMPMLTSVAGLPSSSCSSYKGTSWASKATMPSLRPAHM